MYDSRKDVICDDVIQFENWDNDNKRYRSKAKYMYMCDLSALSQTTLLRRLTRVCGVDIQNIIFWTPAYDLSVY